MADDYAHKMIHGSKSRDIRSDQEIISNFDRAKKAEKDFKKSREKNGSMDYKALNSGITKRIFGIDLIDYQLLDKDDKTTYDKGYYEISNIQIQLMSEMLKPTENVIRVYKLIPEEKKKEIELTNIETFLYEIGKRDYENGLDAVVEDDYYYKGYSKRNIR